MIVRSVFHGGSVKIPPAGALKNFKELVGLHILSCFVLSLRHFVCELLEPRGVSRASFAPLVAKSEECAVHAFQRGLFFCRICRSKAPRSFESQMLEQMRHAGLSLRVICGSYVRISSEGHN